MDFLQEWFERIAGITQDERTRTELAQEIFAKRQFNVAAFETPACWRRKANRGFVQDVRKVMARGGSR
ncbi:hypothetical protein [Propionivibrio limicola]|uniref:hypothetical protein n=1 Tax=Propionivibrio limicola TaxID=167645 RepID=UPI001291815D|nr:hypothetical protein [Propionivibrio limicola]